MLESLDRQQGIYLNGKGILRFALTAVLFAAILAFSLGSDFYTSIMASTYLSLALFSALIVLGTIRRAWLDLLWVLAGALLLPFLDDRVMGGIERRGR